MRLVSKFFFIAILVVAGGISPAFADSNYVVNHYATVETAVRDVFPDYSSIHKKSIAIDSGAGKMIERKLGEKWSIDSVEWKEIYVGMNRVGIAIVLDELGKHYPITFCVILSPKNQIKSVSVLTYREPVGAEIRKKRFMRQFLGKSTSDILTIDRSVDPITGSTLSSWAAITAVKKALILGDIIQS
ncbi:FMN-binding protein [bacterium]|nr:FMN-binding protein [bacterium]